MLYTILKKISSKSMGLLPTVKSVITAFFSLLIIISSIWLFIYSINSSKPKTPDLSERERNQKIFEKEYLLNKEKIKNVQKN